jgi:hypothetical protein
MDAHSLLDLANHTIDKGYWGGEGFVNQNVWIRNDPAAPVSSAWALVFVNAAQEWTSDTNVNINFDGANPPNQTITVRKAPTGTSCTWAVGSFPIPIPGTPFARVGPTITVNSGYNCPGGCGTTSIETVPLQQAIKIAKHEIGHNLGLRHPGNGGGSHLPGTALAATNYSSVMWQGCVGGKVVADLSSDDVLSAGIIYPNP